MKSCGLNKIESVSEVDEMKKERGFVGLGLALVINYMMHQMAGPAIYFGVVLCGLMVFYGKVDMEKMMGQTVVRFVLILMISLAMNYPLSFIQGISVLVLCADCATCSMRIQKSSEAFLENLSIINMILCGLVFCGLLLQMISPWMLMMFVALFQPSGLSLEIEGVHFPNFKTMIK